VAFAAERALPARTADLRPAVRRFARRFRAAAARRAAADFAARAVDPAFVLRFVFAMARPFGFLDTETLTNVNSVGYADGNQRVPSADTRGAPAPAHPDRQI
jgi:hypothetical protein